MRRRPLLLAGIAAPALAQQDWARVAVPFYGPAAVLRGLYRHHALPRALAFDRAAMALATALADGCAPAPARRAWVAAMAAWEGLNAVAVGPLLTRRSARTIDFQPTRPALIDRALAAGPPWDLQRIGTPAKGLPAIEWLLWRQPPSAPRCAYLQALAAELHGEAQALREEFAVLADREWGEHDGPAAIAEFVNQWLAGLERLRWAGMERPLRAGRPAALPRAASGQTAAAWAAHWQSLRALAAFAGGPPPAAGAGLVPIETWLRGRGLNPPADALLQQVARADAALRGLKPGAAVLPAAATLRGLKQLVEQQVAAALDVRLGFSDADGD